MNRRLSQHARDWIARIIETEAFPGEMTDAKIGATIQQTRETVGYYRRQMEILAASERRELAVLRMVRREDKRRPLTDGQLAERAGVCRQAASVIRKRLEIAPVHERRVA